MTDVPWIDWYRSLAKPSWTPAPRTIGLIWQILDPVIIATFGFVFVQAGRGRRPLIVALPFAALGLRGFGTLPAESLASLGAATRIGEHKSQRIVPLFAMHASSDRSTNSRITRRTRR
jgi:hypothetical protein